MTASLGVGRAPVTDADDAGKLLLELSLQLTGTKVQTL